MKRPMLLSLFASLLAASSASAKIMDTWTHISLQFANLSRAAAHDTAVGVSTLNTSGSGAHLNTLSLGSGRLPGLSLNTVLPITDPLVISGGIMSVRFDQIRPIDVAGSQGNPGVLGPISGAVQSTTTPSAGLGTIPSTGMVRICLLAIGCATNLPFDVGATLNGVAQGAGAGGILTMGGASGTLRITVLGAPFTVKTVSAFARTNNGAMQTFTDKGFAHGPLSNTSSTGQTSGVIQFVTAQHTSRVGIPGGQPGDPLADSFSRVVIHFIPEPSLLLLLGSGAAAMAVLGRKRMRR
jgi:hypothetical protein